MFVEARLAFGSLGSRLAAFGVCAFVVARNICLFRSRVTDFMALCFLVARASLGRLGVGSQSLGLRRL